LRTQHLVSNVCNPARRCDVLNSAMQINPAKVDCSPAQLLIINMY
jgi:hypothetical protein